MGKAPTGDYIKSSNRIYVTAELKELAKRSNLNEGFLRKQIKLHDVIAQAIGAYKLNTTNVSIEKSLQKISAVVQYVFK